MFIIKISNLIKIIQLGVIMKTIKFTLHSMNSHQRFYTSNRILRERANGKPFVRSDKLEKITLKSKDDKSYSREFQVPRIFRNVVISDAHTHIERLAFPFWFLKSPKGKCKFERFFLTDTIAGVNTFRSDGGDESKVKPDEFYLKALARANGYKFAGFNKLEKWHQCQN